MQVSPVDSISTVLTQVHHRCDDLFAQAEGAVSRRDWSEADGVFSEFVRTTEHHLDIEERILFPALEQVIGPHGPTQVMRMEHAQMRDLFREMAQQIAGRNADRYLGLSETLLVLIQQHNLKEEQILYRMADQALSGERAHLLARIAEAAAAPVT